MGRALGGAPALRAEAITELHSHLAARLCGSSVLPRPLKPPRRPEVCAALCALCGVPSADTALSPEIESEADGSIADGIEAQESAHRASHGASRLCSMQPELRQTPSVHSCSTDDGDGNDREHGSAAGGWLRGRRSHGSWAAFVVPRRTCIKNNAKSNAPLEQSMCIHTVVHADGSGGSGNGAGAVVREDSGPGERAVSERVISLIAAAMIGPPARKAALEQACVLLCKHEVCATECRTWQQRTCDKGCMYCMHLLHSAVQSCQSRLAQCWSESWHAQIQTRHP